MYVLLTYDISDPKRLKKVAKICENYGIRVQNSVFELDINSANLVHLKSDLNKMIDAACDSVRIYHMHKNFKEHIEILGSRELVEISQDTAIFL